LEAGTAASAATTNLFAQTSKPRHRELHTKSLALRNGDEQSRSVLQRALHSSDRQVRHRPACGGSHRALRVAHEESLSPVYRLKANISLADGVDDWFLAERYRLAAEDTYNGISELVAEFATGDEEGRELAVLRETLDSLADDQRRSKPSQREITEASDTQRSVITTSRATESTASPTDGHAPIAEAQGSQAKLAYRRDLEQSEPSANAEGQQPK